MPTILRAHASLQPHTEALIVPVLSSDGLQPHLARLADKWGLPGQLLQTDFKAEAREVLPLYLPLPTLQKIYLLGLGRQPGPMDLLRTFRHFFFQQRQRLPACCGLDLTDPALAPVLPLLEWMANGAMLGGYDLGHYKTGPALESGIFARGAQLDFLVPHTDLAVVETELGRGQLAADTQRRVMHLGNAPSNYKTPQTLADWAVASGGQHGYATTVYDHAQLVEMGAHALLAVNQGSPNPPALIVVHYRPANAAGPVVGLVGKGVTFDTGGVSLKDSANMHLMKSDMGGAAAVLGAVELAARLQLPVEVVGVVPATENSLDGHSIRPGDVIGSFAGKSIEVIDTDAEGRLILADGLAYILKHHHPDILIDLATLTGSVIGTLGYVAAGLFTANDTLAADLLAAADATGEKLWRLPLWDDYKDDLKSDVADVKNYHGKPFAGAIMGAKFLEVFTDKHPAWAHLDIAGMAFHESEFGSQKNATAYGVRLLVAYLQGLVEKTAGR